MKTLKRFPHSMCVFVLAAIALSATSIVFAYPPAPYHTIYGMLRDEMGTPFAEQDARIFFRTEDGVETEGLISLRLTPGTNYRIQIPMDAGIAADMYRPTALRPLARYKVWVEIRGTRYLPIQMTGDMRLLGNPAQNTRLDLTMGVDSDGDGIPDAYKDLLIAMFGPERGLTREDITPNSDLYGDGMTVMQHYIAGTFPWDPTDYVALDIVEIREGKPVVAFATVPRRSYVLYASRDAKTWHPVPFRLPAVDSAGWAWNAFTADRYHARMEAIVELDHIAEFEDSGVFLFGLEVR